MLAPATYSEALTGESFPITISDYTHVEPLIADAGRDAIQIDVEGGAPFLESDGGSALVGLDLRGSLHHLTLTDPSSTTVIVLIHQSSGAPAVHDVAIIGGKYAMVVTADNGESGDVPAVTISQTDLDGNSVATNGVSISSSPDGMHGPRVTATESVTIKNYTTDGVYVTGAAATGGGADPEVILGNSCAASNGGGTAIACNGTYGVEAVNLVYPIPDVVLAQGVRWNHNPPHFPGGTLFGTGCIPSSGNCDYNSASEVDAGCPGAAITDCSIVVGQ